MKRVILLLNLSQSSQHLKVAGSVAELRDSKPYSPFQSSNSSELRVLQFRIDCMQGLSNIVCKVQEKSPLKYPTVRHMACLDPSAIFRDPDRSMYRVHLDQERRKKESDEQGKKRKALEDHLEELKRKGKLSKRSWKGRQKDLLSFQRLVAQTLLLRHGTKPSRQGRRSSMAVEITDATRFDSFNHWPCNTGSRQINCRGVTSSTTTSTTSNWDRPTFCDVRKSSVNTITVY
ncbi:hypothetical protein INR49_027176 [Caranx melampygus]|nr:hypothetical protein INR49_027176 [Caranx melampygus]